MTRQDEHGGASRRWSDGGDASMVCSMKPQHNTRGTSPQTAWFLEPEMVQDESGKRFEERGRAAGTSGVGKGAGFGVGTV